MVFRHRNFALFFFGLITSNSGTWMAQTARSWLVHEITGSGAALGLVFGAFGIPMVLFPYFGGVIGDRFDRRKVLWVTQIIAALNALVLGFLIATDVVEIWHIVVISFAQGTVLAFDQPPRQALLPDLVPRDELRNAIAMNSSVYRGGIYWAGNFRLTGRTVGSSLSCNILYKCGILWISHDSSKHDEIAQARFIWHE